MSNPFVPDVDTLGNMKPISKVVFSLGSNQGNSADLLQSAVTALADTPDLIPVDVSSVYVTKPVGAVVEQPDFLNLVMVAETVIEPSILLERCHAIEAGLGRTRDVVGGPRTMDIDLVMVGKHTVSNDDMALPHPRAHERAFVLVPWLEIDPDAELAGHGRIADLVAGLDASGVTKSDEVVELP
ncbi:MULTISPECIES: 2-amino-4-hydroxy-6-hydroxymethyldihydropteridine diphosphokinase [unclassified Luteococcus]|uniref:2-amino-4-hydroxy-6- hydroxymethyldihydropteridine diphosphokinase n=1 Tax=unclassified Luteococcus TaxID=2639923 RepID=UPI00313A8109